MKKALIILAILLLTCYLGFPQGISGIYNTDFKELTISQSGNSVTGTYKHQNGRIEGTLSGRTFTGFWYQDNGKGKCIFEFNSDFSGYTGKWGYNDAAPASKWNGTKIAGAQSASTPQQNIPVKTSPSVPKAISSSNPLENGLVSWFPFDGDFNDHSTNSYHATNIGASWTPDRNGETNKALSFDGNSSGVRLDKGFPDVFNGSLTVSMWVNFNDDDRSVLFGSYNTANNVVFEKHTNYRLRIWWNNGQIDFFSPENVVTVNKWFFVTFVRDKGQNKFSIYVNDKEVASSSGIGTDVTPAGPFYIGRDSRTGATVTNGKIDDLKIYNRALTTPKTESVSAPSVIPIAPSASLETLNVSLNNSDAIAGDLKQNAIQLNFSKGTFDQQTKLQVKENGSVPQFDKKRANLIGTPFEITIDQKSKRLNKPAIVKLKLEKSEIAGLKNPGDLWIGYYNGKAWDYFIPLEVNLSEAYVKFETYHFSFFAKAEPTKEERISDFSYENAVNKWAGNDNNTATKQAIEQMVSKILSEKMGLNNKSLMQDIVEAILKENDYANLMVSYNDGRMEDFAQDIAIMAGSKICDIVTNDSNAKGLLGMVTEHSSKIGTGIKIAAALADGDPETAAKELSLEIISSFPLTSTLKTAAEITEQQINRWKDQELEAAYQVFVNGAESSIPFWGYQVEPGKFDEVWAQMRGLETKILDDAIKNYAGLKNMRPGDLNSAILEKIRKDTKESLRQEFIKRKDQESKIEAIKAENIKLIKEFETANLLVDGRFGYTDNTSFDFRLERLFRVKDMILKDTKSRLGFTGVDAGGIISAKTVAALLQIWYSDNGKEKYQKELIRLGYKKEVKKAPVVDTKQGQNLTGGSLEGVWVGFYSHQTKRTPGSELSRFISDMAPQPLLFIVYNVGDKSAPKYRALSLVLDVTNQWISAVSVYKEDPGLQTNLAYPKGIITGFKNGQFLFTQESTTRSNDVRTETWSAVKLKTPTSIPDFPEIVRIENLESASGKYIDNLTSILSAKDIEMFRKRRTGFLNDIRRFYQNTPAFQQRAEQWLQERKFTNWDQLEFESAWKGIRTD